MFTVVLFMLGGIAVGWFLRNRGCAWASKLTTVLIWTLLFLLGVEVGGNKKIIAALPSLGLDALIIAVLSTVGSCALAWVLWMYIHSSRRSR